MTLAGFCLPGSSGSSRLSISSTERSHFLSICTCAAHLSLLCRSWSAAVLSTLERSFPRGRIAGVAELETSLRDSYSPNRTSTCRDDILLSGSGFPSEPGSSAKRGLKSRGKISELELGGPSSSGSCPNWTSMSRFANFEPPELGFISTPELSQKGGCRSRDPILESDG